MRAAHFVLRGKKIFSDRIRFKLHTVFTKAMFEANSVRYGKHLVSRGIPTLDVSLNGKVSIGEKLCLHNSMYNLIGRQQKCIFVVANSAELAIGDNVGISASAIVCHKKIVIEDNVRIGGNCVVYDTDFHSLQPNERLAVPEVKSGVKTKEVHIKKNAFIGGHSTILKGVTIGENAIVGAGSVVAKNIPDNEIWGGNPARFISKL